ncbi:ACP phosphodiesterase [Vibrio viridaestus]|uniref:DUF479 domain-containing protein n=1 Tax=Vibrio viridaestus TaxID=2487322 RepID=A0A3N9TMD0_9VIBR|nr:ACP phosphodiesterase [Vibrio viridaestus]RQW64795.1 DUF479 domain-containing protein [Vibrio viridaestus]
MNYLAHLHIAQHCNSSPLGNLLGDFVRGDVQKTSFSQKVINGIYLHRWVDRYTDEGPLIKELKSLFPEECRRFCPIAMDVFWDHLLAKHWSLFSCESLADFTRETQAEMAKEEKLEIPTLPDSYTHVSTKMWSEHWLESYVHWDNTQRAIRNISKRRPRFEPLAQCNSILEKHYYTIEKAFEPFYLKLLADSLSYARIQNE